MGNRKRHVILITLVLLLLSGSAAFAKQNPAREYSSINAKPVIDSPNILFVGNSHTNRNNMPEMFRKMCVSAGIKANITKVTHPGYSISRYMYPRTDKDKKYHDKLVYLLKNQTWDYIILQGKLMETKTRPVKMEKGIKEIRDMVRNTNAQIVLFIPPETKNPAEMRRKNITTCQLYCAYRRIAEEYHLAMAPVSVSYSKVKERYPDYELYNKDNVHASKIGSYLSAYTVFSTLFAEKAKTMSYSGDLIESEVTNLQRVVSDIISKGE